MKSKVVAAIFTTVLLLVPMAVSGAMGKQISATLANYINVVLDGRQITTQGSDPIIYNGRTYLPVSAVGQALGYNVDWDGETNTVKFSLPAEASPVIQNDKVEIVSIVGTPIQYKSLEWANHHHRGYFQVKMNVRISDKLNENASFLVEVLDSKKNVVDGKLGYLEDTSAGSYTCEIKTDSFRIPFDWTASDEDAFKYLQDHYTYRVTIK